MNPKAKGGRPGALPPLDDFRNNQRIRWYRCPIDPATFRSLSEPSNSRGLVQSAGHLAIWIGTGTASGYLFMQELWWRFAVALFLHGTAASFFSAAHHELCHTSVFRTKSLNEFFLRIFSFLGWYNFHIYRFSHIYHHRNTLFLDGDREEVMPANLSLHPLYLLQLFTFNVTGGYHARGLVPTLKNTVTIASNRFENPYNSWGTELYEGYPKERKIAARWSRLLLVLHAMVLAFSIGIGEPVLAVLVSGSMGRVAAGSYPPAAPSYGRNTDFSVPPAVAVGMRIAAHPPRRSGRGR